MDPTTALIVLILIGWARAEMRLRVLVSELRVASAESRAALAELRATLAESREREVATRRTALELERAIIDGASAQVAALPHLRTEATDRIPGLVRRLIGDAGGSDGRAG